MDQNILEKIRKLLAVAERATTNPNERDAALAKVLELCDLYGIDQDRIQAPHDRVIVTWALKRTFHLDMRCAAGNLSNVKVLVANGKSAIGIGRREFISLSETIYDYLLACMSNHQSVYRQTIKQILLDRNLSSQANRKFIEDQLRNFRKAFARELFNRSCAKIQNPTQDSTSEQTHPGQQLACVNFEEQERELNLDFFKKQTGVEDIPLHKSRAKIEGVGRVAGRQAAHKVNLDPQLN